MTNPNPLVSVVLPVYNEETVIENSINKLIDFLDKNSRCPYKVVIVDNASTDKTSEIGKRLSEKYKQISYIFTNEKGKGLAIRRGWQEEGDILVTMDIDLAYDLNYFNKLVDSIISGYDISLANRLGKNSVIHGRRVHREIVSRIYNLLVRSLFWDGIQDHQCGFKAIERHAYDLIAKEIKNRGWFLDTELLLIAKNNGLKIKPIDVICYDNPGSNIGVGKVSRELFLELVKLRVRFSMEKWNKYIKPALFQSVRFVAGGTFGFVVNMAILAVCVEVLGFWYLSSVFIAAIITLITSFIFHKYITFRNFETKPIFRQALGHLMLGIVNILFNLIIMYVLVDRARIQYLIAQGVTLGSIAVFNFLMYKFLIFRHRNL